MNFAIVGVISPYHSLTGAPRNASTAETLTPQRGTAAIVAHELVISHVLGSRDSLDGSYGVYRLHSDRAGAAIIQQLLNYGSIPRIFNRIFPCDHVHSPREATTKICLRCVFHCTNLPGLGHIPRKPRLTSEAKALIPTGRAEFALIVLNQST